MILHTGRFPVDSDEAIKDMAALPFRPALNCLSALLIAALQAVEDEVEGTPI